MPTPIIPDHFRALFIFKGVSGKPEDVYVNTWHFRNNMIGTHPGETIETRLMEFYDDYASGDPHLPITGLMTTQTVQASAELRVYDLGEAAPREPEIRPITLANLGTAAPLPEEVAIACSYYADRNLPRQRGRIYLGPFSTAVVSVDSGRTRVPSSVRDRIAGRAEALHNAAHDTLGAADVTWMHYSPTANLMRPVTAGWVDDALDTLRTRGPEPSARKVWPVA